MKIVITFVSRVSYAGNGILGYLSRNAFTCHSRVVEEPKIDKERISHGHLPGA